MEQGSMLAYLAVVALMVLTPGPNVAVILQSVATRGQRGGFGNLAGIVAAFYLHALCSAVGLTLVLRTTPLKVFPKNPCKLATPLKTGENKNFPIHH